MFLVRFIACKTTTFYKIPQLFNMIPENLTIDGFGVRTARLNEVVSLIYSLSEGSSPKKKQDKRKKSVLSCWVTLSGFKPETF
jgi:hypothetical protein